MILAMRDATATRHRHGRAARYHVKVDEDGALLGWFNERSILNPGYGVAACDRNMSLVENTEVQASDTAANLICTRPGCRAHVENYLNGVDGYTDDPSPLPVATKPCDKVCRDSLSLAKGLPMATPQVQTVIARRTVPLGELHLEHVHFRNPRQFTGLSNKEIEDLAADFKANGINDPLTVQQIKVDDGVANLVLDGQRRVKAALEILPRSFPIPVIDRTEEPIEMTAEVGDELVNAALTSLRREGLSSYELVAVAVDKKAHGKTLDEIGFVIGKHKSWVSKMLTAWGAASDRLKIDWRKGKVTDEQFKELAELKDTALQAERTKAVVTARESGDKTEARMLSKETKETVRQGKKADKESVVNGVNGHAPKKFTPAVSGPQVPLFGSEAEADKSAKEETETQSAPKPAKTKMISRLALEELLAMADKRPPTADYVKGIMDCARLALSLIQPDKFAKAWHQYVNRVQGAVLTKKKPKPVKAAKVRDASKAKASAAKGVVTKAKKAKPAKKGKR